jgi:hypothetical protein
MPEMDVKVAEAVSVTDAVVAAPVLAVLSEAVALEHQSRMRAASSPRQAVRSQEQTTSGVPAATQVLYVCWQSSRALREGAAETAETRARARARFLETMMFKS